MVLRMPPMESGYARDLISKDRREYRRQREAEPRVAECLCPGEKLELMRRLGNHAHCAVALCCEALGKMIDEMAFVITGDPEYLRQGPQDRAGLRAAEMSSADRRSALHPLFAHLQFQPVDASVSAIGVAGAVVLHNGLRASVRVPRDVADRQQVAASAIE